MRTRASILVTIGLLASSAATGCTNPYTNPPVPSVSGEQPAPPVRHHAGRVTTLATPEAAVRRAVALTGNWTSATVVGHYNLLAAMSVGEARNDARTAAARLPTDRQLTAPGSSSTAIIEAIAHQSGVRDVRRLLVVTRERLTADATKTTRYRVMLATVVRRQGGWALKGWEPQP